MARYLIKCPGLNHESYERHANSAIALKAFFDGKRLSQITPFLTEKYKLYRKTACSCLGGPKVTEASPARCVGCDHLVRAKSGATINRELTMLRRLFNKCIEWKLAKTNPVKGVHLFKENNGRTRYLTQEEAKGFLEACNQDFRIVALAAMHTGFRKSELQTLRWTCVNFRNGSVTVESCYATNAETRTVPLSSDVATTLRSLYDERTPSPEDLVFTLNGKPWKDWRTAFEKACQRAGLRQALQQLPSFGAEVLEAESPRISPREDEAKVVAFAK